MESYSNIKLFFFLRWQRTLAAANKLVAGWVSLSGIHSVNLHRVRVCLFRKDESHLVSTITSDNGPLQADVMLRKF